ncbi:iron complex outermembrane receptor protein [Dyadobacter jejuensis]|uniref:Iron complex outermembrane receptor protein n=1 Tax=Dyadobacter jejuensis TaxID=1082580 RepID=A0A316AAD4_9BACT|nr:TonB-dependent receptor [Dyadobacter jejuensis]PWJ54735.1 iron complex outermembrane receptor protein [Dyadobacter jejuensis]
MLRYVYAFMAICLFLFLSAGSALAQRTISGRITDAADGKPLPGATVQAGDIRGTFSTESGAFVLEGISENITSLKVSYVGYSTMAIALKQDTQNLDIRLQKSTLQADEVIIHATRVNEKSAMAYTDVSAAQIEKQNLGQDLPVLLNFTPSLVSTSDAGAGVGYTGIRIRGSDATRINVTVNGIPYNDAESQGVYWVNMPDFASSVSSIQIQRGVGTSTNGAGAFGATVNVNTNSFQPEAYAELNNSAGSFNTFKNTLKLGTGLIKNKFTVDARLSRVSSDGFVDRAESELHSYYLSAGYFGKKSFVRFNMFSGKERTYQSWYGSPEAKVRGDRQGIQDYISRNYLDEKDAANLLNSDDRSYNYYTYKDEVDNYRQDHYQLVSSHSLSDGLTLNVNAFLVRGLGYYEQYRTQDSYSSYNLPNVVIGADTLQSTDFIRRRFLDNYFMGTTFSADYNSFKKFTASVGGGYNRYDGDHYGRVIWARNAGPIEKDHQYYFSNGLKQDLNFYGKGYYQFTEKLNAYADLQMRFVSYGIEGVDDHLATLDMDQQYTFFNPKAGLNYDFTPGGALYASYSVGNREPNRSDFVDASRGLLPKAERLQDLEAGMRLQKRNWAFSVNYYYMHYKDQLVLTGQINDVGTAVRANVPKSFRMGVELEGALALSDKLKWNVNATFSENKIANFTEYIPDYDNGGYQTFDHGRSDISFSPKIISGSQLSYSLAKSLELALLSKYVGKQYLDNTSNDDRRLDAYFTNDLRLTYTLKPKWARMVVLNAMVNNIFNEKYESNGYTFGYIAGERLIQENFYYPQAGTNFLVGVNLKF